MPTAPSRESSEPEFWNVRYARENHLFGKAPSAFVMQHVNLLPEGAEVLEIGSGEARTLVALSQQRGACCTALDFSRKALDVADELARSNSVHLETICADVRTWTPSRTWDAVVVTFVQLLPPERQRLYKTIRTSLRPGGWVFGQWFRPAHLDGTFDRVGPNRADRMVPVDELRSAFPGAELRVCEPDKMTLDEGRLRGHVATAHVVARMPNGDVHVAS